MTEPLTFTCEWCESQETFTGEDPWDQWEQSGWLVHVDETSEKDYCCLDCAIAAL